MDEEKEKAAALERMRLNLRDIDAEGDESFEVRAVKGAARCLGLDVPRKRADIHLGWLNENCPLSVVFGARRVRVDILKLFTSITRTPGFNAFLEFLVETGFRPSALIVPWKGQGLYVFHNCWRTRGKTGFTRIVRPAASVEKGTVFEPLVAFCGAAAEEGL